MLFKKMKRGFLGILALAVSLSLMCVVVSAADITVANGDISIGDDKNKLIKNSEQSVTISAKGGLFSGSTNTVTVTNQTTEEAILKFSYVVSDSSKCTIGGAAATGTEYSVTLAPSGTLQILLNASGLYNEVTLTLNDITLTPTSTSYDITVAYDSTYGSVAAGTTSMSSGVAVSIGAKGTTLKATAKIGGVFLGWKDADGNFIDFNASHTVVPTAAMSFEAVFGASEQGWYLAGGTTLYSDLQEAATFASDSSVKTVVLLNDATLPAGTYKIPSGVTFLIPFNNEHSMYTTAPEYVTSYTTPTKFRKLTMASGASIIVESGGAISVSAKLSTANGGDNAKAATSGKYGWIHMENDSSIAVNGTLSSYGYITGSGEITVGAGAAVNEVFEVRESRGGGGFLKMNKNSYKVFLVSQYYIQNIEAPMTISAGATLTGHGALNVSGVQAVKVAILGESNSLFRLDSGTLKKQYLPTKDRCQFDLEGEVAISNVNLSIMTYDFNSNAYILPINGHMDINLNGNTVANINRFLFADSFW